MDLVARGASRPPTGPASTRVEASRAAAPSDFDTPVVAEDVAPRDRIDESADEELRVHAPEPDGRRRKEEETPPRPEPATAASRRPPKERSESADSRTPGPSPGPRPARPEAEGAAPIVSPPQRSPAPDSGRVAGDDRSSRDPTVTGAHGPTGRMDVSPAERPGRPRAATRAEPPPGRKDDDEGRPPHHARGDVPSPRREEKAPAGGRARRPFEPTPAGPATDSAPPRGASEPRRPTDRRATRLQARREVVPRATRRAAAAPSDGSGTVAPTELAKPPSPLVRPEPDVRAPPPVDVRIGSLEIRAPGPSSPPTDTIPSPEPPFDFSIYQTLRGGGVWRGGG